MAAGRTALRSATASSPWRSEATVKTGPGFVAFYDTNGSALQTVGVGSLPDMLTFTPDGSKVLVANEGEPDGGINPLGTVSIIDVSGGVGLGDPRPGVTHANFSAFNGSAAALAAQGANFAPGTSVDQDVEPEYIAVSEDGTKAFVSNQETNTLGVIDINTGNGDRPVRAWPEGLHPAGNALDPSDTTASSTSASSRYSASTSRTPSPPTRWAAQLISFTANEGDAARARKSGFEDLNPRPDCLPDPSIQDDDQLGRLEVITTLGDTDMGW